MVKIPKKLSFVAFLSLSVLILSLITGIMLIQQPQDYRSQAGYEGNPTIYPSPPPIYNPNRADVNNDGKVNVFDIIVVIRGFRESIDRFPCLDVNEDGLISVADIILVVRGCQSQQ